MIELPEEGIAGKDLEEYLLKKVWPFWEAQRERLAAYECWVNNTQEIPVIAARHSNAERQVLLELSRSPWMGLMVNTFAQQLIVDGYRKSGSNENAKAWDTWNRNHMKRQQFSLNRAVLTFGLAYMKVTAGEDPLAGEQMAEMRAKSPLNVFAIYEDPYGDEWPLYVLEKVAKGVYWWWDSEKYTVLEFDRGKFTIQKTVLHGYTFPPFVRYVNQIDLDGRCYGDVEPVVQVAKAIDKTRFDILLVQHYQSFMVRWGTGLMQPDSDPDIEKEKLKLAQEGILISSNKEAKFGTLPAGDLTSLLDAYKQSLTDFLAATQLPPHITGQIVNVAADALTAGTRPTVNKLHEKQESWAVSHNQTLRLVNDLEGRHDEATNFDFSVHWQDVEIKSLAQFADAWGKMVEQLKIPAWGVWDMIPGIDQSTVEGWKKDYNSDNEFISFIRALQTSKTLGGAADPRGGSNSAQNTPGPNNRTGEPASLNTSGKSSA